MIFLFYTREEYIPPKEEMEIFKEVAQDMYEDARNNYHNNDGFGTHVDVETSQGLVVLAECMNMSFFNSS